AAMNFKPAEADWNVLDSLEAPEQRARIADVIGRQSGLEEGSLEPVALPPGKRRGEQAAACHDSLSLPCARGHRVLFGRHHGWPSIRLEAISATSKRPPAPPAARNARRCRSRSARRPRDPHI